MLHKFLKKLNKYPVFPWGILALFFIIGLLGILNHSMWRDELNAWLVARDSTSFLDLIYNVNYEGHPLLWYLCLAVLNQFTHNPVIMQVFHLCIATVSASLILIYSPFSKSQKILFIFSYLPFYEYLLISRNYAFGFLFIIGFCVLYPSRYKTYLGLATMLLLMANSNAYGLLISFVLFLTLILDLIWCKVNPEETTIKLPWWDYLLSVGIYISGIITSLMIIIPPADSALAGGLTEWSLSWEFHHFMKVLSRIWNSYILILLPTDEKLFDVVLFGLVSVGIFLFFALSLLRKPIPLFLYITGTFELWIFTYIKMLGSPRHYGHFLIILLIALWISSYYQNSNFLIDHFLNKVKNTFTSLYVFYRVSVKGKNTVFMVILLCQLIAGLIAFNRDLVVPFSASRATANYIKQEGLDDMFIAGSYDAAIAPISGYLQRKVYYPQTQEIGSFVLFTHQRGNDLMEHQVLIDMKRLLKRPDLSEILLILTDESQLNPEGLKIQPIAQFTDSLIYNEKYYLYRVTAEN